MLVPRPIKKIVRVFRGDVHPLLALLSVLLGFWFGLTPGFYGFHVAVLVVALVLNVHIGIFLLSALLGKALCFAAAPVLYHVGVVVQDALAPLLTLLASIPLLGVTDFARYAVDGAMVIGPIVGLVLGLVVARAVVAFRRAWLRLDEGSEKFRTWRQKWWVRLLDRLLFGKNAKDVREVLGRRPKFIRKAGVVVAAVVVILAAIGVRIVENRIGRDLVADALTKMNGAEVDVASFQLKVLGGTVTAGGIQVTDPDKPTHNTIAIASLSASASPWNLLRGRLVVDDVSLSDVKRDSLRETPGHVLPKPPENPEESWKFDPSQFKLPNTSIADLESYFRDAKEIRERFKQLRDWLPAGGKEAKPKKERTVPESYLAYLAARAPVPATPRVIVRRINVDKIETGEPTFGTSRIQVANVSDAPSAAGLPVSIEIQSEERPSKLSLVCHYDRSDGGATITGELADVDLARFQERLSQDNPVRLRGGTATVKVDGTATRRIVDIGLAIRMANAQLDSSGQGIFGMDPRVTSEALKVVENLEIAPRIVGPIEQPRLYFDADTMRKSFGDALVRAGKGAMAEQVTKLAGEHLPGGDTPGGAAAQDAIKTGQGLVGGLLGGGEKKDDKKDNK